MNNNSNKTRIILLVFIVLFSVFVNMLNIFLWISAGGTALFRFLFDINYVGYGYGGLGINVATIFYLVNKTKQSERMMKIVALTLTIVLGVCILIPYPLYYISSWLAKAIFSGIAIGVAWMLYKVDEINSYSGYLSAKVVKKPRKVAKPKTPEEMIDRYKY